MLVDFSIRKKSSNFTPNLCIAKMIVEIITKYLESNKRLVVPNLGTFIVKVAGESVLFSALIKNDDGVLRSLVQQQGMSELEAAGAVDRFVFEVNYRLQNDKECRLKGFGVLKAGDSGAMKFVYDTTVDGEDLDSAVPERKRPAQNNQAAAPAEESVVKESQPKEEPVAEPKAEPVVEEQPQRRPMPRNDIGNPRVSVSAKMNPENYVKGLRYGKGRKVGIVYAEWNDEITYALRDGAVKTLVENGVDENDITLASVPGSFELIFGASQMVKSGSYDAVIAIGCVIRGDTPHFDYICEGVTAGLAKLNVEFNVPVIFGLITTNNLLQAQERAGGRLGNKGDECAVTALQMMAQFK